MTAQKTVGLIFLVCVRKLLLSQLVKYIWFHSYNSSVRMELLYYGIGDFFSLKILSDAGVFLPVSMESITRDFDACHTSHKLNELEEVRSQ